jgi:hypothetical protein
MPKTFEFRQKVDLIFIQINVVVSQLDEFRNVGADYTSARKATLHHTTTKPFAQRVNPNNIMPLIFLGDLRIR